MPCPRVGAPCQRQPPHGMLVLCESMQGLVRISQSCVLLVYALLADAVCRIVQPEEEEEEEDMGFDLFD
eukprot:scaffold5350_cov362-Prasinococcus_capsulatus_cf.AAC.5